MKLLLVLTFIAIFDHSYCQIAIQNTVLATSGKSMSNSSLSMEYTFGETFTQSLINSQLITQGFQQPYRKKIVLQPTKPTDNLGLNNSGFGNIILYPNPFASLLNIENHVVEPLQIEVLDIAGKSVLRASLTNIVHTLNLEHLACGPYRLIFTIDDEFLHEETIIKIPN